MKIVATIAHARAPKGWEECFTATKHDATYVDCRNQIERLVNRYNLTMSHPADLTRELLCLRKCMMVTRARRVMSMRSRLDFARARKAGTLNRPKWATP